MRLDTNYKKRTEKKHKQWRWTNTFQNNQQVTEEIKREIKEFLEINENLNMTPMGSNRSSSEKEVYSNAILPQEIRKTSNRQPNFTPKTIGKKKEENSPKLAEGNIS